MQRITDRIPRKVQDISSLAAVFAAYFFFFDRGKEYPVLTIVGTIGGAWVGYEMGHWILRRFAKKPK